MDPPPDLPQKRQSLTSLGGNAFKFLPPPDPSSTALPLSQSDPLSLSFDSIPLPKGKKYANLDMLTSAEYDTEGQLREFAGQLESKNHSLREIYLFRKSNFYSNEQKDSSRKTLQRIAEHYLISREKVSQVSDSFFCYSRKNYPDRVIPFKDELSKILKIIHLKRSAHLTVNKCVDRACELKVYWPGYLKDIRQHILACSCSQGSKKWH